MKLHIPKKISPGKRWYCGPHAFAVITGNDFETTRWKLNTENGRAPTAGIRGYPTHNLCLALKREGYRVSKQFFKPRPGSRVKFKEWIKNYHPDTDAFYLLELTQHFVVVKGGLFIDNHSGHAVSTVLCPHLQKNVKQVFEVRPARQTA